MMKDLVLLGVALLAAIVAFVLLLRRSGGDCIP